MSFDDEEPMCAPALSNRAERHQFADLYRLSWQKPLKSRPGRVGRVPRRKGRPPKDV